MFTLINHVRAEILSTGRIYSLGLIVHQQRYRLNDQMQISNLVATGHLYHSHFIRGICAGDL
jgi:hypothetical protein